MDPSLDAPPAATQPTAAFPAALPVAANPTPSNSSAPNHPPYSEMITAAITALNERNGSSKKAIARYIQTHYSNLLPGHSALLTNNLNRLTSNAQLVMVKRSYMLPRSAPLAGHPAAPLAGHPVATAVSSNSTSSEPRKRGRPPKPKNDPIQAPIPVFNPPVNLNALPVDVSVNQSQPNVAIGPGSVYVDLGPINGPSAVAPSRGRGRAPRRPGRPPKRVGLTAAAGGILRRGRGRPKKNSVPAVVDAERKGPGRPRGRPRKPTNVAGRLAPDVPTGGAVAAVPVFGDAAVGTLPLSGAGVASVSGKRRGRPLKADGAAKKPRNSTSMQPAKPRKLSGKPLGRPKKGATATADRTPDSQLLAAYLDLKAKLDNLQARIKHTASLIKPCLNSEAAISALDELETVALNISAVPNAQSQQPQPEQPQPEQPQPEQPLA